MPSILVTGGAGYIGSNVCKALAEAGFLPVTIDNLSLGHRELVRWGPLVEADIRNSSAVGVALRAFEIVAVVHLAAFAYVGESVTNPGKYYDNNVLGTLAVLEAMRSVGTRNIVFSSSCAVYGTPTGVPINEATSPMPINPYGRSKLIGEQILQDFASAHNLAYVALRYFNASGADLEALTGENRVIEPHLIPRAMMALLGHIDDFQVLGSTFPTPDGTAIRDYIHVKDLAEAHVRALHCLLQGKAGGVFNVGTGTGYSVKQVLDAISRVTGRHVTMPIGAQRLGDPPELVADNTLAMKALGFQPCYSDMDTIIMTAWQWHTKTHPQRQPVTRVDWRTSRIG